MATGPSSTTSLRVIYDEPLTGPENMARDESLLTRVGSGESPPTLRFYQWDPPTISLGYFQKYADYEALPPPAGDLAVVRRLTGGGAILHDQELTYSITVPLNHKLLEGGPNKLYERAHDALIAVLDHAEIQANRCGTTDDSGAAKGPFFCFERRHCLDVLIGNQKLAGSAQRRTRQAVLQHGSIVLERRYDQQPAADLVAAPPQLDQNELASNIAARFSAANLIDIDKETWTGDELAIANEFIRKYQGNDWTKRL